MGKFTAYKVPLKTMSPGKHEYTYHLDKTFFDNMESADIRGADVDVALTVDYDGEVYRLTFAVTGTVTVQCDRCLDEMPWPIEASYSMDVKYGDDYNDDSDTLMEIPWADADLNVAYMIYDTASLAVPIKHCHPLGKCNRAMTTALKKHRVSLADEEDDALADELMDSLDDDTGDADDTGDSPGMDGTAGDNPAGDNPVDPRWEALRALRGEDDD